MELQKIEGLEVQVLNRKFEFEREKEVLELMDPNPDFTIREVVDFYAHSYPELMNASYSHKEEDGCVIHKFVSIAGTKG